MRGKICGTGSYVPETVYDNHDIAQMVDTSDAWIQERTGIVSRHIAVKDTTATMAIKAARAALEDAQLDAEALDLILVATSTSNHVVPGMACEVQKALGAAGAAGFDVAAACSGFVFAYQTAQAFIASGIYKTVLVIGSECLSSIVDWEDRSSCILFGDGAGAVVLCAQEGELLPCVMHLDGEKGHVLACESRHQREWQKKEASKETLLLMDGKEVFRFAVKKVPEVIDELLDKSAYDRADIDWFILHQANLRIIESVAKRMQTGMEKFPVNISGYGNTSSASIPILLDEMHRDGRLQRGQKVIIAGFGGGLSWGAALIEWQ